MVAADSADETALIIDGSGVVELSDEHLARAKAGGVTAINHTVTRPDADWEAARRQIAECSAWIESTAGAARLVRSYDDLLSCRAEGVEGIIYGPQDAAFLEDDLGRVDEIHRLGVRILQLTYQGSGPLGDGCGVPDAGGLTGFGRQVVHAMDDLGIVVDLSHVSEKTSWDAIRVSRNPVAITHAHASAMTDHPRSKSDELIRAVAEGGGVIGVTASSALGWLTPGVQPTVADLVRHIEYLLEVAGPEHVGIGLDLDETNTAERHLAWHASHPGLDVGGVEFPYDKRHVAGIDSCRDFPKVAAALAEAGLSDDVIAGIVGGNFARVFRTVWTA